MSRGHFNLFAQFAHDLFFDFTVSVRVILIYVLLLFGSFVDGPLSMLPFRYGASICYYNAAFRHLILE